MDPFGKHGYKVCWVGKSWNQENLELDVGSSGEGVVQDDSQFPATGEWVSGGVLISIFGGNMEF